MKENQWFDDKNINLQALLQNYNSEQKINSMPLEFQYVPIEILSKEFTKLNNQHQYRIHYLGPRFLNTMALHKKYSRSDTSTYVYSENITIYRDVKKYSINIKKIIQSYFMAQKMKNNHFYKSAIYYRAFQGMNPSLQIKNQYIFNSIFQSGNLDCVIKINHKQFDLFLRIDSNTRGHTNWFYFSVKNGAKKQKIRLNICNLTKPKTLYDNGMRPYIYSEKKYRQSGKKWQQGGQNLGLQKKQLRYQFLYQKTMVPTLYTLTLQYQFQIEDDQVFFAYCIPYTYSQLMLDINKLPTTYTKIQTFERSLSGVDIPILHISNHESNKIKKNVLITGRIHPGQTNSSHVLGGFMQFLCSQKKQAKQLRDRVNFFIIPMVNPDGVILGNTRTSAAGKDLNRQYLSPSKDLYPQIYNIKMLMHKISSIYGMLIYFDFHGHSRKKNTFFYGPIYNINQPQYYKCRILPKLIQKLNNSFRFHSCIFNITEEKKKTARAVMIEQFNIPYSYTIQSSIGFYYDSQKMITYPFEVQSWKLMGQSIGMGISLFFIGYEEYQLILKQRRQKRKNQKYQKQRPNIKNIRSSLNVLQDQFKNQTYLKIFYQGKDTLFSQLIQQLKTTVKVQLQTKGMDDSQQSDDHDQKQDLQISKLKQFNNLVIQNARKDSFVSKISNVQGTNQVKLSVPSFLINEQKKEEIDFIRQISAKPKTSASNRVSKHYIHNKTQLMKKLRESKLFTHESPQVPNQKSSQTSFKKSERMIIREDIRKRISSTKAKRRIQTLGDRSIKGNVIISEYNFPDASQINFQKVNHNSINIFHKGISRQSKRKIKNSSINESSDFSPLRKHQQKPLIKQFKFKPPVEFKFQDVISNLDLKSKILRQTVFIKPKRNSPFPSSFYGVQQQHSFRQRASEVVLPVDIVHVKQVQAQALMVKTLKNIKN